MKVLRVVRNIAVLFIFGMALLFSRPGVQSLHAQNGAWCMLKFGYNGCEFDANGNCSDTKCVAGQSCTDTGCVQLKCKHTGC
jgi:hypothetical protein